MTATDAREPTFEDLKLLTQVSQLLTLLDLDRVMQQVIQLMSTAVGAAKASLFLHDEGDVDWDHIFLTREMDMDQSIVVVQTVLTEGLAGWVLRHRQPALVYDTETDARWHVFPEDENPARSALCVPFTSDEHVLAVLTLVHPEPKHFTEHHLRLMQIVANQAAVALSNAQLFYKVQAQQRQLEVVLRAIPDVLLVLDEAGQVLLVNDPAVALLDGVSQEAMYGRALDQFAAANDVLAPIKRIIAKPAPDTHYWSFEIRSVHTAQDMLVTMSRWTDAPARRSGFVIVMHDVTALRDLHRFKDEMLKVVSHDLRNPVSLIITSRDMLAMDMPPLPQDSAIPQYMSIIQQATERMEKMVDELLRAEGSNRQNIDPVELINSVVDGLRPLARQKKQTITLDIELDEVITLVIDPVLIREAMENYLSNAIKYTAASGEIIIRSYADARHFYFEVQDNGIGIAAEHIPQLFEPYFRVDNTATRAEAGYGIGLNLVKTIVERHKGEVMVTSEEGVGSCFGFWLPL